MKKKFFFVSFFVLFVFFSCTSVKDSQVTGSSIGPQVPTKVVLNGSEK